MGMKYKLFLYIIFLLAALQVKAQDPIFTQFYLVPEHLNPAFTGVANTWNAGLIHRRQWPNGNRKIDTEYGFVNNLITDEIGVGLTVLNNKEVFTDYNYFQLNGVFAYRIDLDDDWRMRFGLEAGYGRKDYNFKNLLLEDQINSNDGSISANSTDPGILHNNTKLDFMDVSVGFVVDQENAWFGATLKHINRPDISFTEKGVAPLDMFLTVHGGYYFPFDDSPLRILPDGSTLMITGNYMRQSQYDRLDIGAVVDLTRFSFGVTATTNPEGRSSNSHLVTSVNPIVSLKTGEFTFGYSYDISTSRMGQTRGVHELTLTWLSNHACSHCDNYKIRLKRNGVAGYTH